MGNGIYVATSGAVAQSEALDVIANNVANSGTAGYRAARVSFNEVLVRAQGRVPSTPASGSYVSVARVVEDAGAGNIVQTDNPLDLALMGDGYFTVDTTRGPRYTRAGNFTLSAEGVLGDAAGNPVRAQGGGPIVIPPGTAAIDVGSDGTVLADGNEVGVLELSRFTPNSLSREGATLYAALPGTKALAQAEGQPEVISGALEQSNVNSVRGIVDLIKVSRTYEALLSAIETYRQIDSRAAQDLGGPK